LPLAERKVSSRPAEQRLDWVLRLRPRSQQERFRRTGLAVLASKQHGTFGLKMIKGFAILSQKEREL